MGGENGFGLVFGVGSEFQLVVWEEWIWIGGAKAEDESDAHVDPLKVKEKLGAVPHGLSTDSDVAKRLGTTLFKVKADDESDTPVDPPKVEEKLGAIPHGLSTDSDVTKRLGTTLFKAKAEDECDAYVDPPKVEEKLGVVPHSLSTDSNVAKRFGSVDFVGRKLQAKVDDESDAPVDPPKVKEKLRVIPLVYRPIQMSRRASTNASGNWDSPVTIVESGGLNSSSKGPVSVSGSGSCSTPSSSGRFNHMRHQI
ncbi:hypothetical protein QYF36_024011 [Acer negundo]|nr:hypothetical protein QYF36_024011 [Acer negundo]